VQLGLYYERHGKHYKEIMKRSKLLTSHMQANKEQDHHHIDYVVPPLNGAKQKEYANFIAREYLIRGLRIDQSSNYNEWRDMLRVSISMEKYLTFLENVRQWHEDGRDRVPIIEILELLVPCILHLENRVVAPIILHLSGNYEMRRDLEMVTLPWSPFKCVTIWHEDALAPLTK